MSLKFYGTNVCSRDKDNQEQLGEIYQYVGEWRKEVGENFTREFTQIIHVNALRRKEKHLIEEGF